MDVIRRQRVLRLSKRLNKNIEFSKKIGVSVQTACVPIECNKYTRNAQGIEPQVSKA